MRNRWNCRPEPTATQSYREHECMNGTKHSKAESRDVTDLPRASAPRTAVTEENVAKLKQLVFGNRRYSLKEAAQEPNASHGSVRTILGMKRVAARLFPEEPNFSQKKHQKSVAKNVLSRVASDSTFV